MNAPQYDNTSKEEKWTMETLLIALVAVAVIAGLALLATGAAALGRKLRGHDAEPAAVEAKSTPATVRAA